MAYEDPHLTDEDLLLAADGELSPIRQSEVRAHLASCWTCRARQGELETTIADFVHLYHGDLDSRIPGAEGPAALLRATLAQPADPRDETPWAPFFPRLLQPRLLSGLFAAALCCGTFAVTVLVRETGSVEMDKRASLTLTGAVPDSNLTPGLARPISKVEVCTPEGRGSAREAPRELQQAVFQEYGITRPGVRAYEVDYLITPELGGASDIRNLWPEPYFTTVWNARVKDVLEDRLREMVCQGDVDLATAQHDLSTDWIAAYQKYFHTDWPLISEAPFEAGRQK
jgi:Putative zinc-finger